MEISKLKIIKVAKDEIRRKFFESRSANGGKMDDVLDTSDQKTDEDSKSNVKQVSEKEVGLTVVPRLAEASVSEDDGFPMITSVFSLASHNEKANEVGSFSNGVRMSKDNTANTPVTLQNNTYTTMPSSNGVPASEVKNLPFVVNCSPSGFITVSSPPKPTSSSTKCGKDRDDSTTLTPIFTSSLCTTKSSDKTLTRTVSHKFPSTFIDSSPNLVTFIDATQHTASSLNKPSVTLSQMQSPTTSAKTTSAVTDAESSNEQTEVKALQTDIKCFDKTETFFGAFPLTSDVADSINKANQIKADSCDNGKEVDIASSLNSQNYAIVDQKGSPELPGEEDNFTHSVPTKQDEKIRKLKDLLRQKEAELEKFRFKTQPGSHSPAAQLRANFLKKNPLLGKRSTRLDSKKTSESNTHVSTPSAKSVESDVSGNKKLECNNETSLNTQECSSGQKLRYKGEVRNSRSSLNRASSKFSDQDKYKLVDVTVVHGHTRTLAVPLKTESNAAVSMRNKQSSLSFCNNVFKTARKRKQEMPKKFGPTPAKQKSIEDDDINSRQEVGSKFGKVLKPVSSSNATMLRGSNDIVNTGLSRSIPRKTEGQPSPKVAAVKRKSPNDNELDVQNGASALKKAVKSSSPCETYSEPTRAVVCSKAESALKEALDIDSMSTSNKSSTELSTTSNTPNKITSNVKHDAKQVTTNSHSSYGKNGGHIFHVNHAETTVRQAESFVASNKELAKSVEGKMSKEDNAVSFQDSNATENSSIVGDNNNTNGPQGFSMSQMTSSFTDPAATGITDPMVTTSSNNLLETSANTSFNSQAAAVGAARRDQRNSNNGIRSPLKVLTVNTVASEVPCVPTTWIPRHSTPCTSVTLVPVPNYTLTTISLSTPIASSGTANFCSTSTKSTRISITRPIAPRPETFQHSMMPRLIAPKPMQALPKSSVGIPLKPTSTVSKSPTNLSPNPAPTMSAPQSNIASKPTKSSGILSKPASTLSGPTEILSKKPTTISPKPPPLSVTLLSKPATPQGTLSKPILTQWLSKSTPTVPISIPSKCITPKSAALKTISISGYVTSRNPSSHRVAATSNMVRCASPNVVPSSTLAQSLTNRATKFLPLNQVINVSPKAIMSVPTSSSSAFSENLGNGKIFVYDVVQSNQPQQTGSLGIGSKESAKLVVHVSNKGESRHLGIIKDNKIYLNTNQVAIQPQLKSTPTTTKTEFIPNPQDAEFKALLGLDYVVTLLS